ncbi:tetratricopeptide repeat protein [bacterium]|nr:tetratricopeptide repeat protein [bacterium]
MNSVRPRPYPQRNNGTYNAGNSATDKDGQNSNGQEQRQQQGQNAQTIARGRADEIQQGIRSEINSPAQNPYPVQHRYPINHSMIGASVPINQVNPHQYQSLQAQAGYQSVQQQDTQVSSKQPSTPQRSNKVNIAQILKDFRNTIKAIATPPDIVEEVNRYLQIVETQVREPKPQVNLIQSNLKIAASMLDKYISETLNKDSKVVQNWLDALFLQRINYNYDAEEINPTFSVRFPDESPKAEVPVEENKREEQQEEVPKEELSIQSNDEINNFKEEIEIEEYIPQSVEEEFIQAEKIISHKPNITIIPQDTRLKSLFVEAKKQAFSNNPQKAMAIFKEAFNRASELKDTETQSRICLEIGKIYDDNDFVAQALNSYYKSLQYTTDTDVKSRAHYSMAQIYDDVNEVEQALNHYFTSISYAGNSNDLIGQSDSLTRVANIFTDKYNEEAFEYYDIARKLIEQTADNNMKGYVLSNTADACVQFRKNDKALKYYAEAVKNYEKTNAIEEIAQNYKSAAELMIQFNSPNKAKSLLKKAMVNAVKTQNEDLISEINMLLASVT